MDKYQVIVGNVGQVWSGNSAREATTEYNEWVRLSKAGVGRAAGEDVTLLADGEPVREHAGKLHTETPERPQPMSANQKFAALAKLVVGDLGYRIEPVEGGWLVHYPDGKTREGNYDHAFTALLVALRRELGFAFGKADRMPRLFDCDDAKAVLEATGEQLWWSMRHQPSFYL